MSMFKSYVCGFQFSIFQFKLAISEDRKHRRLFFSPKSQSFLIFQIKKCGGTPSWITVIKKQFSTIKDIIRPAPASPTHNIPIKPFQRKTISISLQQCRTKELFASFAFDKVLLTFRSFLFHFIFFCPGSLSQRTMYGTLSHCHQRC